MLGLKNRIFNYGVKNIKEVPNIDIFNLMRIVRRIRMSSLNLGIRSAESPTGHSAMAVIEALKESCRANAEFFRKDDSENGQRLHVAFLGMIDHVNTISPMLDGIRSVMSQYDFDEQTPGNGYRSFVVVADSSISHASRLSRHIQLSRESFIFRKGFYMREVEAICHVLASLGTCFQHLHTLREWSAPGELFPSEDRTTEELLSHSDSINQYCFYGRCLGLQFCESMQNILKSIAILMASFSETYYSQGGLVATANSLLTSSKFLLDPELRARRIVNISQHASVDFCKSFWFLAESEVMKKLPSFVCPTVAVNKEILIPPEPLSIPSVNGPGMVDIPIPSSHIGTCGVQVRLISAKRREGMMGESTEQARKKDLLLAPSPGLIVHCHGGGFVAQSSKAHEVYLRDWAHSLDVPILSIDYSLAPQAPYPRALEEVFYCYCWALNNCRFLGSTAERVILAGDSAGANLNLVTALKCLETGVRPPSGVFLAYVPVVMSFVPSPGRLLCLMDPLLPFGFMMRCLKAYASPPEPGVQPSDQPQQVLTPVSNSGVTESETESFEEVSESDLMELMAHKSPISEVSDTLTTVSLASSQLSKPEADQYLAQDADGQSYVLDTDMRDGKEVPVVRQKQEPVAATGSKLGLLGGVRSNMSNLFSSMSSKSPTGEHTSTTHFLDSCDQKSPTAEFRFSVPKDYYLSPYWAPDRLLARLPPTSICTVQFDPCLDDCVMFAKKLKRLGNSVKLDVLDGLPHGFLNFSMISKDAYEGSKLCVKRIKDLLDMDSIGCCSNMTNSMSNNMSNSMSRSNSGKMDHQEAT